MIESIHNLIHKANAQHMQLTIRADENGTVSIIANTLLKPTTGNESKDILSLRSALMTPLLITGDKGEVDVEFSEALTHYANAFVAGAQKVNNSLDSAATIEKATKSSKSEPKNTEAKAEVKSPEPAPCVADTEADLPSPETFYSDDVNSL